MKVFSNAGSLLSLAVFVVSLGTARTAPAAQAKESLSQPKVSEAQEGVDSKLRRMEEDIRRISDELASLVQRTKSENYKRDDVIRLRELNAEYQRLSFELEKALSDQQWELLSKEDQLEKSLDPGPGISDDELKELILGH